MAGLQFRALAAHGAVALEHRQRHKIRRHVVGGAKRHGKPAQRLVATRLQPVDEAVTRALATAVAQAFHKNAGGQVPLHAGVVGLHGTAGFFDGIQKLARQRVGGGVGRRHHLGDHHTGTVLAQLVGQRLGAHKRHVVESAAIPGLACRPHKGCTRLVGTDLHHRVGSGRHQFLHCSGHIDRITLHRGQRHRFEVLCGQGQGHAVEAGLAIGVVLVEHRNFLQAQFGELFHDERRFVVVRRTHMEHVAVERFAQRHGPGEGGKKRHPRLHRQRQRRQAGRGADVAEQCQHVVVDEFAGVLGAAFGLVAVVQVADFNRTQAAALGVDPVKMQLGPLVKLDTQLRSRPSERGRLAHNDLVLPLGE